LLGTDGLFDNVFDDEILKMVIESRVREQKSKYDQLAKFIALAAEKYSNSPTYKSPFSISARNAGFMMTGGMFSLDFYYDDFLFLFYFCFFF